MKRTSVLPVIFTVVMLVFVLFLIWYLPAAGQRRFQLEDVRNSLELSRGQERKQQYEYENTIASIPETKAELENLLPRVQAAENEVDELKKERSRLRDEKKTLEESLASGSGEVSDNE